ncbi:MAG: polyprenyl synthetase family protein [Nitrososphaerales archaeon]
MDIMQYWKRTKPIIDRQIDELLPSFTEKMPQEHVEILKESIEGGKRARGTLTCLVCEALGGRLEDATSRAVAIEYIHAATLIHDDYVDLDTVRRSRPAIWTLEGSRRAVLFGDLIFSSMINMMSNISNEDVKAVAEAIATVASGAFQEPLNPLRLIEDITTGRFPSGLYDVIINLKTGALFGAAAKLGAIAAKAMIFVDRCYEYGARCGEAFQISDDLREVLRVVETGKISLNKMVTLAPACLYFSQESMREVLDIMSGRNMDISELISEKWASMIERMGNEIDVRLTLALKEIESFPKNDYSEMMKQAPRQMVRLMLEQPAMS